MGWNVADCLKSQLCLSVFQPWISPHWRQESKCAFFLCRESTVLPHGVLCVQTDSTHGGSWVAGNRRRLSTPKRVFYADLRERLSADLSTATATDSEARSPVGENEFMPVRGVLSQAEREGRWGCNSIRKTNRGLWKKKKVNQWYVKKMTG